MITTDLSQFPPNAMRELTSRICARENMERVARQLGMSTKRFRTKTTHVAKLGRHETVESNLPIR